MKPSYELKQEFKYMRKAAIAWDNNQRIRYYIYLKLMNYYTKKHEKKIMSS